MTVSVCFAGAPAETQRAASLLQQNTVVREHSCDDIEVTELPAGAVRVRVRGEDEELTRDVARCVQNILGQCATVHVADFTIGLVRSAGLANSAAGYARRLLANP
jgi:hypothetical protein